MSTEIVRRESASIRGADSRRSGVSGLWNWWQAARVARREARELHWLGVELGWQLEATLINIGSPLVHHTQSDAGIPHTSRPVVAWMEVGPPLALVIEVLPGQLLTDYRAAAVRIAAGLRVPQVRVTDAGPGLVRITLLLRDPLTDSMPLPATPAGPVGRPVLLGADDTAQPVTINFADRVHLMAQGWTNAGKSHLAYSLLRQLAGAPDALIAGCDPTSVLLRPFAGSRHAPWQVLGADPLEHVEMLERLVAVMRDRLARIPERTDVLPATTDDPYLFVVLEEWTNLLVIAQSVAKPRGGGELSVRDRLASAVRVLAAEGGKVGVRLVMLLQRAEANELGMTGGFIRGQFAARITLPVDNADSVKLLHPTASPELIDAHLSNGRPGVALYSAPGRPLCRLRTPQVGNYAEYWDDVHTACHRGAR